MSDESTHLRRLLESPETSAYRLEYADWLEKNADPRSSFLRMDPALDRINYIDWLGLGQIEYYIENFPQLKLEAEEWQSIAKQRELRHSLGTSFDPNWVSFIKTLGCPFQPFFFFNNHGSSKECQPDELPFAKVIGTRGPIVTFESDFRNGRSLDPGLMHDLHFLTELPPGECAAGATTCPTHPFICELNPVRQPLTGANILAALQAKAFQSQHIESLAATSIPYPGYHPGDGRGPHNDEIHNDFEGQYIFQTQDEDENAIDEFDGTHGKLKRYVVGEQLWYVLLHTTPQPTAEFSFSRYVVLFAVGLSPNGGRLLGIVTHQTCHNLCD